MTESLDSRLLRFGLREPLADLPSAVEPRLWFRRLFRLLRLPDLLLWLVALLPLSEVSLLLSELDPESGLPSSPSLRDMLADNFRGRFFFWDR